MKSGLLYITHRVPWPPDRGDRIRTWNVLKALSARTDVDLLCFADEPVTDETLLTLKSRTRRLAVIPLSGYARYLHGLRSLVLGHSITEGMFHSQAAVRQLRSWAAESYWQAALCSSSGVAHLTATRTLGRVVRRWTDLIDVDSQKWIDYSRSTSFPWSWIYSLEARRLRNTECILARECERLLVVSEAERSLFLSFCDSHTVESMSNGVDTRYFAPREITNSSLSNLADSRSMSAAAASSAAVQSPSCVFIGVMNYLPNVDAVCWFARNVWPEIRRRYPHAVFQIVGRSPSADVQALAAQTGVQVIGGVPDVRPWLHQSTCVVVPLRIARGIQNKVLEAMASGCAVISSAAPMQAFSARAGEHLMQADVREEWIESICRLFSDECLRRELGAAARCWVEQHHSWNACLQPLNELFHPHPEPDLQTLNGRIRPGEEVPV